MAPTNYDLSKVIRDLLRIAQVAMPDRLYEQDSRVQAAYAMLDELRASQHRPPGVRPDQSIPYIGESDPSDPLVAKIAAALHAGTEPDIEVSFGLDAFLASPEAPATRPAAIEHILRDWLIGHGYIPARPPADSAH